MHLKCSQVACVSIRFGGGFCVSRSGCRTLFAMGAPAPSDPAPSKGKGKTPLSKGEMLALKGKLAALKGKGKLVGKKGGKFESEKGKGQGGSESVVPESNGTPTEIYTSGVTEPVRPAAPAETPDSRIC